jgi:hypothetical protein
VQAAGSYQVNLPALHALHRELPTIGLTSSLHVPSTPSRPGAPERVPSPKLSCCSWSAVCGKQLQGLVMPHKPALKSNVLTCLLDDQHRWDTARRLLHDKALKAEDRLAGLLVLLYAQGATTISRMTTEQIHTDDHDVRLRLGRVPIQLPEPVATLARAVIANRVCCVVAR